MCDLLVIWDCSSGRHLSAIGPLSFTANWATCQQLLVATAKDSYSKEYSRQQAISSKWRLCCPLLFLIYLRILAISHHYKQMMNKQILYTTPMIPKYGNIFFNIDQIRNGEWSVLVLLFNKQRLCTTVCRDNDKCNIIYTLGFLDYPSYLIVSTFSSALDTCQFYLKRFIADHSVSFHISVVLWAMHLTQIIGIWM